MGTHNRHGDTIKIEFWTYPNANVRWWLLIPDRLQPLMLDPIFTLELAQFVISPMNEKDG